MNPYPFDTVNFRKFLKKLSKCTTMIQVEAVICGILSNYDQLLDTVLSQTFSLSHKVFHRNGLMRAPYERNRTI